MTPDSTITHVGLSDWGGRWVRYHWAVRAPYGGYVAGWTFTRRGAERAIRRAVTP